MLNLNKRPCRLGNSMSTNTERHGDEDVGAIDLPLDGLVLTADEFDALLGSGAHEALYRKARGNGSTDSLPMPRFEGLKPFAFKQHFEHARVELFLDDERYGWADCKVRNVQVTLQAGGLSVLKCSVRARAEPDEVAVLYDHLNRDAGVAIRNAKIAQPTKAKDNQTELPLGESEQAEAT